MRIVRMGAVLSLAIFGICFVATSQNTEITVTGKLSRVMAIGGRIDRLGYSNLSPKPALMGSRSIPLRFNRRTPKNWKPWRTRA